MSSVVFVAVDFKQCCLHTDLVSSSAILWGQRTHFFFFKEKWLFLCRVLSKAQHLLGRDTKVSRLQISRSNGELNKKFQKPLMAKLIILTYYFNYLFKLLTCTTGCDAL